MTSRLLFSSYNNMLLLTNNLLIELLFSTCQALCTCRDQEPFRLISLDKFILIAQRCTFNTLCNKWILTLISIFC